MIDTARRAAKRDGVEHVGGVRYQEHRMPGQAMEVRMKRTIASLVLLIATAALAAVGPGAGRRRSRTTGSSAARTEPVRYPHRRVADNLVAARQLLVNDPMVGSGRRRV